MRIMYLSYKQQYCNVKSPKALFPGEIRTVEQRAIQSSGTLTAGLFR
jgi:hypothetical protein